MLKFILALIVSIPLCLIGWKYIIETFFLVRILLILNLNSFFFFESVGLSRGFDLLSYILILLRIWICVLIIIRSEKIFHTKFYNGLFIMNSLLIGCFLILSFSTFNIFIFYLYFERSLIPIFLIILGWGYQRERLQAGIYILLYTLFGSLPLLLMIMIVYTEFFTMSFLRFKSVLFNYNWLIYLCFCFAFFIKLPIFLIHFWLPKAHVEAPVAGSIILAGVLLKLGGYGLIRVLPLIRSINLALLNYFFIILSLLGGVLIRLNCLIQRDIKLLIAYSSVAHIGIILRGLLTLRTWGLIASLGIILGHGLCSSGLFFLVNLKYEKIGSRRLFLIKGALTLISKMRLWWFLFCVINIAAPPSLNLLREICLINSIVSWGHSSGWALGLIGFFAAGYSLYLFSFSQHGKVPLNYRCFSGNLREYLILCFHWVPLNVLLLNFDLVTLWI